jgi:hypothetical protein
LGIHGAPSRGLGFDFSAASSRRARYPILFLQMIELTSIIFEACWSGFRRLILAALGGMPMDSISDGPYGYGVRSSFHAPRSKKRNPASTRRVARSIIMRSCRNPCSRM